MRTRATLLGLVALVALAAAASTSAQRPALKIGLLAPLTGPQAANGKEMQNGLELFLEQEGGRLAGREVSLIVADDESKPAVGLTRLRGVGNADAECAEAVVLGDHAGSPGPLDQRPGFRKHLLRIVI